MRAYRIFDTDPEYKSHIRVFNNRQAHLVFQYSLKVTRSETYDTESFPLHTIYGMAHIKDLRFGKLYKGKLYHNDESIICAVKESSLKRLVWDRDLNSVISARHYNQTLGDDNSPWRRLFVGYYGRSQDRDHLYLLQPFALFGDMSRFVPSADGSPPSSRLTEKTSKPYLIQVALALQYLHICRVKHRYVRPSSCLIFDHGQVKLTGFRYATTSTEDGNIVGDDCRYYAPETYSGFPYTPLADWWSFGIMIFHLLTQNFPFEGNNWGERLKAWEAAKGTDFLDPLPLAQDTKDLLSKMLKYNPTLRFLAIETVGLGIISHDFFKGIKCTEVMDIDYKMDNFKLSPIEGTPIDPCLFNSKGSLDLELDADYPVREW